MLSVIEHTIIPSGTLLRLVSPSDVTRDPQCEETWDKGHHGDHQHNPHQGTRKSNQPRLGSEEDTGRVMLNPMPKAAQKPQP